MSRILSALLISLSFFAPVFAADTYRIVHTYPHDSHAFTQGLVFVDGRLYESTGINGQSSLRMVDLETGRVLQRQPVDSKYFAEGLTNWGSTLVQLTWESHVGLVYDRFSFRLLRTYAGREVSHRQRWHASAALLRSGDIRRSPPRHRERPRQARHRPE